MKKIIILIFALFLLQNSYAQAIFAPKGATWRYVESWGSFSSFGSSTVEYKYIGDTLVLGKKCKKIYKTSFLNKNNVVITTTAKIPLLIYQDGGKVYRLVDNSFQLAYNFDAKVGDTVFISNKTTKGYKILITNILNEKFGNEILRKFEYKLFCASSGKLTLSTYFYQEKFGFLKERMFPDDVWACVTDGNPGGRVRCYKDSTTTEILLDKTYPCDYVQLTSVSDDILPSSIQVFGDKTNKKLHITIGENTIASRFVLYDTKGTLIYDNQLITSENKHYFSMEQLNKGIYFWQVFSSDKLLKSGKLLN